MKFDEDWRVQCNDEEWRKNWNNVGDAFCKNNNNKIIQINGEWKAKSDHIKSIDFSGEVWMPNGDRLWHRNSNFTFKICDVLSDRFFILFLVKLTTMKFIGDRELIILFENIWFQIFNEIIRRLQSFPSLHEFNSLFSSNRFRYHAEIISKRERFFEFDKLFVIFYVF